MENLLTSDSLTPFFVDCPKHGKVFLTYKEYKRQMADLLHGDWQCPVKGCTDVICHRPLPPRYSAASRREATHKCHASSGPDYQEPFNEDFPVIAGTHWGENLVYVRDTPHKIRICHNYGPKPGFADWEYTDSREKAMKLSRYWWRRFRAERHCLRQCAHWWEV